MNSVKIDGIAYDLPAIEKDCWVRILNGSLQYKNPLHNPVVANVNEHGVNLRTVVLRKVDIEKRQVCFHTDIRSGKWEELKNNNKVSWLFYHPSSMLQIRMSGTATLHQDDLFADEAWANTRISGRKIYLGDEGPSSLSAFPASGLSPKFDREDPTPEESEAGRKNFAIISTQIHWMEWLWLNSGGHRRATFQYTADGKFSANWLLP
ncbi:MAG: pyridoxamine 5'-phosphate oxidase family protein [Ferruginibacter sp.]|nr:pyridoxamine 5'-phosphate oxidase family protein [Ferruginibacter sp.]